MNDEEAKAIQEVAKTTGMAIDASRELGGFISKILGGGFEELGESFRAWCGYFRYTQMLKIRDKVEVIQKKRHLEGKSIPIPPKFAIPLIENASLEDDESIQNLWAGLIVNATDPDKRFQIKKVYIDILSSLEPLDAMILKSLSKQGWNIIPGPHSPGFNSERISEELDIQICDVEISLQNLSRLGCVSGEYAEFFDTSKVSSGLNVRDKNVVCRLSVLGTSLLNACEV
jgi:hypothetical protein